MRDLVIPTPIYISGPMTGIKPDWNYSRFNQMAAMLRAHGLVVINPAENFGGNPNSQPRTAYMRLDIQHLLAARSVLVLEGWTKSRGALLEVLNAKELGLPIFYWKDGEILPLPDWIGVVAHYEDSAETKRNQEREICGQGQREANRV